MKLAKFSGFALIIFAAFVVFTIIAFWMKVSWDTEQRIEDALQREYSGSSLSIRKRHEGPLHQVCFAYDLEVVATSTAAEKIGMVVGDDDGGTWRFAKEYKTFDQCKAQYDRGLGPGI